MFRSGGTGTTSLCSPAGTSDSSGFSEQRDSSFSPGPGGSSLHSQQQQMLPINENIRVGAAGALYSFPNHGTFRVGSGGGGIVNGNETIQNTAYHGETGRGSPSLPFSYHNQALTASPYSTLPRRPGGRIQGGGVSPMRSIHGPAMNSAAAVGYLSDKHSPLMLELGAVNSFRGGPTASLGRKTNPLTLSQMPGGTQPLAMKSTKVVSAQRVSIKTPLLEDDRESCV